MSYFDDMYYESKENFYDRVNKAKKEQLKRSIDEINKNGIDVANNMPPGGGLLIDAYYGIQNGRSKALNHKMKKSDKDTINELYKKKQMKKEKIDKMRKRKIDGKYIDEDLFKKRKDSLNKTTKELGEMMRYRKEKRDKMRKSFESVMDELQRYMGTSNDYMECVNDIIDDYEYEIITYEECVRLIDCLDYISEGSDNELDHEILEKMDGQVEIVNNRLKETQEQVKELEASGNDEDIKKAFRIIDKAWIKTSDILYKKIHNGILRGLSYEEHAKYMDNKGGIINDAFKWYDKEERKLEPKLRKILKKEGKTVEKYRQEIRESIRRK